MVIKIMMIMSTRDTLVITNTERALRLKPSAERPPKHVRRTLPAELAPLATAQQNESGQTSPRPLGSAPGQPPGQVSSVAARLRPATDMLPLICD